MRLTNRQRQLLHEELLESFNESELEQMLSFHLNKSLSTISSKKNFSDLVFDVVEASKRRGWTKELIEAAYKTRPHNKVFRYLAEELNIISSKQPPARREALGSEARLAEMARQERSRRKIYGIIGLVSAFLLLSMGILIGQYINGNGSKPTPTPESTIESTPESTIESTSESTIESTSEFTVEPTSEPTVEPTSEPTIEPTSEPTIESIQTIEDAIKYVKKQDKIVVGIVVDIPPMVEQQGNGSFEGFDINILNELISRWTGSVDSIEFRPVTVAERISCAASGECDLVISAITRTFERCHQQGAICSDTYFNDGARLLVRKDSGIEGIADLDGKTVAVMKGSTGEEYIANLSQFIGYAIAPQVKSYDERVKAIGDVRDINDDVDALASDGILLQRYEDGDLEVVGAEFTEEPYVIVVNENHPGLKELINLTIQAMKLDGTYDILFDELMKCRIPPLPIVTNYTTLDEYPDFVKSNSVPSKQIICEHPDVGGGTTYSIAFGETLGEIALRYYGRFNFYECIQDVNNINNHLAVPAGKPLTIPALQYCQEKYPDPELTDEP